MSSLIFRILESGDLSKAGDLFSVEDSLIVSEFDQIVQKIKEISSAPVFLSSHNDQSLVEIVVTRLISAVRETNSIQLHARCMVDLLQSCLSHSLRPGSRGDPPHAKMASDLMSCLFLNYNKKTIMILAIPVAVKFLHKGNKELSRNLASYLSLAAIENADMLAIHCQPILDSVISGNYSLARVLPAIYNVDCQLIKNHVMTLVSILPNCTDTDSLALLTLFHLLSKDFPQLLEPSLPQLCECLTQPALTAATIQVLQEVGAARPQSLHDHIPVFKTTAERFPATTLSVLQLLTVVCIASVDKSREHINFVLEKMPSIDSEKHTVLLKDLTLITSKFPSLLNTNLINRLSGLEDMTDESGKTLIEEIKNEYNIRRLDRSLEKLSIKDKINTKSGATLVSIKAIPDTRTKESRPIGRFSTHRSMTRLNIHNAAGRLDNRLTHKSMTRLDHRYFSNQLVAAGAQKNKHLSLVATGSPPPGMSTVKSMSSGSVTGLDYNRPSGGVEVGWRTGGGVDTGGWTTRGGGGGGVETGGWTRGGGGGGVETGGWSRGGTEGAWDARDTGGELLLSSKEKDVHLDTRIGSRDQLDPRVNSRDQLDPRFNSRDKLTLSINKITTDLARQSSRLSTVLNQEYNKSTEYRVPEYTKGTTEYRTEYEKPPPEYSRISAEYKMPPDYKSVTGEYGRHTSGSGRDIHIQPHSISSYQSISLSGQKRSASHSSGPIYSPTRMYSSGQLMTSQGGGQGGGGSQQPSSLTSQPPAYSDSVTQQHQQQAGQQQQSHRHLSGSIPLGPSQTYPFPGQVPALPGSSSSAAANNQMMYQAAAAAAATGGSSVTAGGGQQHVTSTFPSLTSHIQLGSIPGSGAAPGSQYHGAATSGFGVGSSGGQLITIGSGGGGHQHVPSSKTGFSSSSHALQLAGGHHQQQVHISSTTVAGQHHTFSLPSSTAVTSEAVSSQAQLGSGELSSPTSLEASHQPVFKENSGYPGSQDHVTKYSDSAHNLPKSTLSNTLPSLRKRSAIAARSQDTDKSAGGVSANNRMSVFEPFPMRDTVQHFCEKHLDKIKIYMESVSVKIPLPVKCTIEERKGKKHAKLHFACQGRGEHCLYKVKFYTMKTRHPRTWIHLMFLALQSRSTSALSTRDAGVSSLKNCWEIIKCEEKTFSTLVTGAFPPAKDQDSIVHELSAHRFFDVFEYNAPYLQWGCFLCNHPERASTFIQEEEPVIEGQLKEKSGGKWKIFKKWKSRYFTLSGAKLVYKESKPDGVGVIQTLDVGSIRSVKVSDRGRNIPKAFEIFTADKTYILKAKDSSNAQEWVQCLSVAVAHSQARDTNLQRLGYGGSLGRLTAGAGRINHPLSGLYSNVTLRTAV